MKNTEEKMLEKFCLFIKDKCRNDCQFFTTYYNDVGKNISYFYYCSLDTTENNLKKTTYLKR